MYLPTYLPTKTKKKSYCLNIKEFYNEIYNLQVLRQTTLPIVPTRHQTFQRQLSHRLEMPSSTIQFSICSLEHKSETSLAELIRVRIKIHETLLIA